MDPVERELEREAKIVWQSKEGIQSRILDLDRSFDKICYLLSPQRRLRDLHEEGDPDWGWYAIYGEGEIAKHAQSGQGFLHRYNSPLKVKEIANNLKALAIESLKILFDSELMEEQGVYKAFAYNVQPGDWQEIKSYIENFIYFYNTVAEHPNEGILILTD